MIEEELLVVHELNAVKLVEDPSKGEEDHLPSVVAVVVVQKLVACIPVLKEVVAVVDDRLVVEEEALLLVKLQEVVECEVKPKVAEEVPYSVVLVVAECAVVGEAVVAHTSNVVMMAEHQKSEEDPLVVVEEEVHLPFAVVAASEDQMLVEEACVLLPVLEIEMAEEVVVLPVLGKTVHPAPEMFVAAEEGEH